MNKRMKIAGVAGVAMVLVFGVAAKPPAKKTPARQEIVRLAEQMDFKEAAPGVSKAVLWGDPTKGPYAAITKFAKGTKVGLHSHSHDIKAVVISGTLVYDSGKGEQRLGSGSYLFEPAGLQHTTAAGEEADCVIMEQSNGAFDLKMVK